MIDVPRLSYEPNEKKLEVYAVKSYGEIKPIICATPRRLSFR